jgi:Uma2 family endonuclease
MGLPAQAFVTLEEYLASERHAEYKNEYWNGQIFAMSGGTSGHSVLPGTCFPQ